MADSDYMRVQKDTRRAAEASAARAAFTARKTAQAVHLQEESLVEARRAAAAAEASYDAQIQSRDEQRAHNYAMWRQTADGQAYEEWKDGAWLLISGVEAREQVLQDAFVADANEFIQKQTDSLLPGGYHNAPPAAKAVSSALRVVGVIAFSLAVVTLLILVVMWLFTFVRAGFNLTWVGIFAAAGVVSLVASGTAWLACGSWRAGETVARDRKAAERRGHIGFDPIAEPERSTYPWTADYNLVNELRAFIGASYIEHPSAKQLPILTWPVVRSAADEVSPAASYYLEQFAAEDGQKG